MPRRHPPINLLGQDMPYTSAQLLEMNHIMMDDMNKIVQMMTLDKDFEFWARNYIRAYGAWLEGSLWIYKMYLRSSPNGHFNKLEIQDKLYMMEMDWRITSKADIELSEKKIKTKENVKAFYKLMTKMFPEFKFDFGAKEWSLVMEFYDYRDAMMHPRNPDALILTKSKATELDQGRAWLCAKLVELGNILIKIGG